MVIAVASPPAVWSPWEFLEALGDGLYGVDAAGDCMFINGAALKLLGYESAAELVGRNMHAAIHHTRPDGSHYPVAECPLMHTTVSGHPVRLENEMLWRKDGTPFFAEYSAFPIFSHGGITGTAITFADTSTRRDAQKRLSVEYTVSQMLAGSASAEHLPEHLLEAIGVGLNWDVGMFWRKEAVEPGHEMLRCVAAWRSRDAGGVEAFSRDRAGALVEFGAGLPGRVWLLEKPIHVADLADETQYPRQLEAGRIGLRCAFAFPVMDGGTVIGAMEFYSAREISVDETLLEAVSTLGHQIGQTLERRRDANALTASERTKAAILAASPDSIITVDAQGRIVEFNATAERSFGYAAADVAGKDLDVTVFPADTHALHRRAFERAVEGDAGVIGRRAEVDAVRADGTRFPVELTITRTAADPTPLFTVYMRDVTTRRREQARTRESEARFRTIANAIPQLAWMAEPDGLITWYNKRWYDFTGTKFEDMAGWGWRSVHHPDHLERVEIRLRHCFRTGEDWEDTFPLKAANGDYSWFLSRAMPIREEPDEAHPEGRILGWFGTNTDVTTMREAERTLELARDAADTANRAKSTFIANMSHELRTPLSAIIGYAEMLTEELGDGVEPAEMAGDMHKIEGNARHLLGLINDVLDLSKVESGKMEAFAETFDVEAMVREVAATVDSLIERKANHLVLSLDPGLGTMHSDVTRIRQMLLNLLSNAAKFTEHGTITLVARREQRPGGPPLAGDCLCLSVTDTGIGMNAEQLAKLFQRFQQADLSTTRQYGGTGLGLALTKAFVTLLGGEVEVTSAVGEGSTFTITLPAVLPVVEPAAPAEAPTDERTPDENEVVLIVDDDATQRDLMTRFLRREGYAAVSAADGPTGLALARKMRPRAILLDVTMPGMDGWSVLSVLKADPDLAGIPVVMVTFVTERALAETLGAADYIVKPVDWDRLRVVMGRFHEAPGTILVVDDEEDTRAHTRFALQKHGWTVVEAGNGTQALERVAEAIPQLILLDLNMPVMDGFTFLRELRARPGCASIPVVVLTALDLTAEDRRRLRGVSQVLNKGNTSLRELAETLRTMAAGEVVGAE